MSPAKREFRLAVVVEVGFFPVTLVVAVIATGAVAAGMHVIYCMTAVAGFRQALVMFADMAGITTGFAMFPLEGKIRFVVIESDLVPGFFVVTV